MQDALNGVRVIDFGHVLAGPICTMMLGALGAEVIKVETRTRPDEQRAQNGGGDLHDLESNSNFFEVNLSKKSCTINLTRPEGRELAKKLVATADIVLENMRPGVMHKLGLDYDELVKVKPDIIMLSLSGFGATGPLRRYAAYNPCFTSVGGLGHLTGYPEKKPNTMTNSGGDARAGTAAVFAALTALNLRQQHGRGCYIDSSSCETINSMIGDQMMDYAMNRRSPKRTGNDDKLIYPHNVYKCAGEDEWISISIGSDAEWEGFCDAICQPELKEKRELFTHEARHVHAKELDDLISAWTSDKTYYDAMHILQAHGVPAAPSFKAEDLFSDPHIRETGAVQEVEHPVLGKRTTITPPYRMSETPARIRGTAPLLGGDNDYVFKSLLGMTDEEVTKLAAAEVIC
jgi:crotonobetainyl-CoA:carnitine CoA-transferase CaiB-like acyl-CoA transferase